MQSQVNVTSTPTPPVMPVRVVLLQRKCACGGTPGTGGEYAERRRKQLTRQAHSATQAEPSGVPPIVHEALNSCRSVLARSGAGAEHLCARPTDGLPVEPGRTGSATRHRLGRRRAAAAGIEIRAAKGAEVKPERGRAQLAEKYCPDSADEPSLRQRERIADHGGTSYPHVRRRPGGKLP